VYCGLCLHSDALQGDAGHEEDIWECIGGQIANEFVGLADRQDAGAGEWNSGAQ